MTAEAQSCGTWYAAPQVSVFVLLNQYSKRICTRCKECRSITAEGHAAAVLVLLNQYSK